MAERDGRGVTPRRWTFGRGARAASAPGEPVAMTGLEIAAAIERDAGSRLVAGAGLASRPELAGAERGGLAIGLGLALGGVRAALFLAPGELSAASPLLTEAVARRVPLVVVSVASSADLATARGRGATLLVPATVGEVADFALLARRFAESALAVVVVALDGSRIARAIEDVHRPAREWLASYLGSPADEIHAQGAAEPSLFGRHRRRSPRWHDSGRPLRLGGEPGPLGATAACAGAELLFDGEHASRLDQLASELAAATGRELPAISGRRLPRADLGLILAGPDAAEATAALDTLRAEGMKVGVLAVHRLAPFPAEAFAALAGGCRKLAVVERLERPGEAGALHAAIATAVARSSERTELARLLLAGPEAPLGIGDLAASCRALIERFRPTLVLGFAVDPGEDRLPKRRALADALRRDLPELDAWRARAVAPEGGRRAARTELSLLRGVADEGLAEEAARLLFAAFDGHLRSRMGTPAVAGRPVVDHLRWAAATTDLAGGPTRPDVAVALAPSLEHLPELAAGAALLLPPSVDRLPPELARRHAAGSVELYEVPGVSTAEPELDRERWLGALLALFARRLDRELPVRRARSARERQLGPLGEETRERRLEAFVAGYEGLARVERTITALPVREAVPTWLAAAAATPSGDGNLGDPIAFWDRLGQAIADGEAGPCLPDPSLVVGAVPPASAPLAVLADHLPRFDPTLCTACGACWSLCPHGAIVVTAARPGTLLDGAIDRSAGSAEALRRHAGKLAARAGRAAADCGGGSFGALLRTVAEPVFTDARLDGERRAEAETALGTVAARLGSLPVAATELLYTEPESTARGSGELLALALDPDRCTGCGICVAVCEPSALTAAAADSQARETARAAALAVAALPPPGTATVARLRGDSRCGPLAGALLAGATTAPLGGFDAAAPGSQSRLAVRQLLGAAAFHLASSRAALAERVATLTERLRVEIHRELAEALPDRDLDALSRGLDSLDIPAARLGEVAGQLSSAVEGQRVDVPRLRRLVDAARAVADLEARLRGGGQSVARAPLAVVVGPGDALAWARRFPDNPFTVPATVALAEPLAVAHGLALAEVDRAVAEARALRRAALELERPGEAASAHEPLTGLTWSDLDPVERALATPLFVLVDETATAPDFETALSLVAGDLRCAVATVASGPADPATAWARFAAALPGGWVAHATIAHGDALDEAVEALAGSAGGALVRMLAPAASAWVGAEPLPLAQARQAVDTGRFPLGFRDAGAPAPPALVPSDLQELERRHQEALAALEARHCEALTGLEADLRRRLAEGARQRLLALAAKRRNGGAAREAS